MPLSLSFLQKKPNNIPFDQSLGIQQLIVAVNKTRKLIRSKVLANM